MNTSVMPDLLMAVLSIVYAIVVLLMFGGFLTWVERKQGAVMADRVGANRAYIRIPFTNIKLIWLGLFHVSAAPRRAASRPDCAAMRLAVASRWRETVSPPWKRGMLS